MPTVWAALRNCCAKLPFLLSEVVFIIIQFNYSTESCRTQNIRVCERSAAMKAPVGLLSDRTVLRSKMEGPRPDKFVYVFP